MGSASVLSASLSCKTFTKPLLSLHEAKPAYSLNANRLRSAYNPLVVHCLRPTFNGNGTYPSVVVSCSANDSASGEETRALETVLKLYEAIKNRNVYQLSDIIAEECLCVSNFVSTFQPFHGKKQVLAFFSSLMNSLGNNIQFIVQNTVEDGMVVSVSWKLEWKKIPIPLGKGFSFYMCHVYQGKRLSPENMICLVPLSRNLEIFLEPLLHVEPLRLKVISLMMNVMEKLNPQAQFKDRAIRASNILFILVLMAAALFSLKSSMTR